MSSPSAGDLSDCALVERFLVQCDPAAFAALVRRHGATVLGVCRRVLGNHHDAEDAFQATFLVLARKARTITRREALGSWLYGVAYRVALKARADAGRRRKHERAAARQAEEPAVPAGTSEEVRPIVAEEISRLPNKYRWPVVLCYYEGKTYQEAARLLGWPAGTTAVRLARARARLRNRLAVRGVALSAAVVAGCLAEGAAWAAEGARLADATADAALRWLTDPAAAGVSTQVIALTEGVVKAMVLRDWKALVGVVLVLGMTLGSAGALWRFTTTPAAAADRPGEPDAGPGDRPPEGGAGSAIPPLALPGGAPLHTRIGLLNMQRVLKGAKHFQALQAELRARTKQAEAKLAVRKQELQKYQAAFNDATPAGRREEVTREIRRLKREIEDEQDEARAIVTRMTDDAVSRMYREVEDAANRLARARGLELVLFYTDAVTPADFYKPGNLQRKLSQPGALMPLYVAPGMDITESVIAALNQMRAPPQGPRLR
jgi:RNA polymerase sigma-70 factor (ECF subfamily)